jgi:hypothetical protein
MDVIEAIAVIAGAFIIQTRALTLLKEIQRITIII